MVYSASVPHDRSIIHPNAHHSGAGMGRHIAFHAPRPLSSILTALAAALGGPRAFMLATPQISDGVGATEIKSAAVCNGSGGSVLGGVDADLLVTGEISHHEALAAVEAGRCVVALCHSNSERGYLRARMRRKVVEAVREECESRGVEGEVEVCVSEVDRDPYGFVTRR